jgi:hypothetical protein
MATNSTPATPAVCRSCGCTEDDGCIEAIWMDAPITCIWIEPDLCSACANGERLRGPLMDHRAPATPMEVEE